MSASVLGREQLVTNLSKFKRDLVDRLVTAVEIVQTKVVENARSKHGADAHRSGRFVTRTGGLEESIQPGEVKISNDMISGDIEARMPYASNVEDGTSKNRPYPFMKPALFANAKELQARARKAMGDTGA
jgi:hypothetical protein